MYKRIDFTKLEGIATYQDTLDYLQASYRDAISAIARSFGSKVIVTGVTDQGTNTYSDGWVVIDGELMPFAGGLKTDRVIIEELSDTEVFSDGSTHTVYYTRRAKLGITGGFAFSEFIRVSTLSAISEGLKSLVTAHNNLQVAYNAHSHTWDQITNKPSLFNPTAHRHNWNDIDGKPAVATVLRKDSVYIEDCAGTDDYKVITFPSVGTSNYIVTGSLVSTHDNWNADNDVFWMIKYKSTSYFYLLLREVASIHQYLYFDYALIAL